ncbi:MULTISPECIES: flippase [Pasteurellaceae]|uniref:flippase n=1 Tax=Pasteurellaceae TaxID=712 RepID=UPI0035675D5E
MSIRSVKFNFLMNLLLTVTNFLFPLITFPYVSRILLPEGTGKVAFAYAIVSYFSIFASFGVANYGIRACAKVRDNKELLSKTVQEILGINLAITLFVYLVFSVCVIYIEPFQVESRLFWISSLNIILTILGVEWLYKGLEQYLYIAIRSIVFKLISLILVFTLIKSQDDYTIYAFIMILATVGSGIVNLFNLKRLINLKIYTDYQFKKHIKPMAVFFMTTIAVAFYVYVSVAILGIITDNEEVGYYDVAYRVRNVMVSIVTTLGAVLLPRLSYYVAHDMKDEFNRVINKSMNFVFLLSLPLVFFSFFFSESIIFILAGSDYLAANIPLKILSIIILIVGISNLTGIQMLIPLGKEKYLCYSVVLGAIINIILNYILIPKYGASGTALSIVVTELIILLFQVCALKRYISILFGGVSYIKIVVAICMALFLSFYVKYNMKAEYIAMFIITSTIFFGIYFLSLLMMKEKLVISLLLQIKSRLTK